MRPRSCLVGCLGILGLAYAVATPVRSEEERRGSPKADVAWIVENSLVELRHDLRLSMRDGQADFPVPSVQLPIDLDDGRRLLEGDLEPYEPFQPIAPESLVGL